MKKLLTILFSLLLGLTAVSAYHYDNTVTYTATNEFGPFGPNYNSEIKVLNDLAIKHGERAVIRSFSRTGFYQPRNLYIYHYRDYPSSRYYGYPSNSYRYSYPANRYYGGYGMGRRMSNEIIYGNQVSNSYNRGAISVTF